MRREKRQRRNPSDGEDGNQDEKESISYIIRRWVFLAPLLAILCAASLVLYFYVAKMSDVALQYTTSYLEEINSHDVLNIKGKIISYQDSLAEAMELLHREEVGELQDALDLLKVKRQTVELREIYLIGDDGTTYSSANLIEDCRDEPFVRAVLEDGKPYVAKPDIETTWYNWNNYLIVALPTEPMRFGETTVVGICGTYPFSWLEDSLQMDFFGGKGISTLIDRKGNVLSQSGLISQRPVENNFLDKLLGTYPVKGDTAEAVVAAIRAGEPTEFRYDRGGTECICVTRPIEDLGLTMVTAVPLSVANQQYTQMLLITAVAVILIGVFIAALLAMVYRSNRRAASFQLEKRVAEQLAAGKSAFLSNMSHEIRTPLNAIIGFSELLSRNQELSEQGLDQVKKIESSSHYLLSLINDILDMSRIDSGKMELRPEPMELDGLLTDIDSIIGGQAKQRGIRYRSDNGCPGLCVSGDSVRVQQVLMNLLGNALKFTPPEGEISLNVECRNEDETSATVRFVVSDTGCGMSPEFLEQLFTPFTQEYNKNTGKQAGTGLGLSICYSLVGLMNGTILVESRLNEGSRFTVELPFEKAEHPRRADPGEAPPEQVDWSGVTILVAEDNELNMEILTTILEMHEIKTLRAVNGREACDVFCASEPDAVSLIPMDMQMPVMDGLEATERIRASAHPRAKTVPILAVTANAFTSDVEAALAHGMNDHIAKPIDPKTLFAKLAQYLYKGGESR